MKNDINDFRDKINAINARFKYATAINKINALIIERKGDFRGLNLNGCCFYGCNLSGCDLYRADLSWADLSNARLGGANLTRCNLSNAKMYRAYLDEAKFNGADLSYVDLSGVYAHSSNFTEATMRFADLTRADLTCSTFYKTNLASACLIEADLTRVDLSTAHLTDADLTGATTDNKFYSFSGFGDVLCRIIYDASDDIVWHKAFVGSLVDWQKYIKNAYPKLSKIEKMEYRQVINVLKFLRTKEQAQNLK